MKTQHFIQFCFVIILLSFMACTRGYYIPIDSNLLNIAEKGEAKVALALSTKRVQDEPYRTYAFQAGYSPINRLSVFGQYMKLNRPTSVFFDLILDDNRIESMESGEFAIGTYFKKKRAEAVIAEEELAFGRFLFPSQFTFDIYAGYGRGQYVSEKFNKREYSLDYNRYFLQLGTHLNFHVLSIGFGLRTQLLDFTNATYSHLNDDFTLSRIYKLENQDPFLILEPSIRIQLGIKHARFFFSTTSSNQLGQNDYLNSESYIVGMEFSIHEWFQKRKAKKKKQAN